MKNRLKAWLDRGAVATGVIPLLEGQMRRGLTVLMYHRVLPDELCPGYPLRSLVIPVSAFRAQVELLSKGYLASTLGTAVNSLSAQSERRPVAVTFDDGYRDNFEHAAPVLEEFGLRATFFAATDFVGERQLMWFDEACLLFEALGPARAQGAFPHPFRGEPASPGDWMQIWKELTPAQRYEALDAWRDARAQEGAAAPLAESKYAAMLPDHLRELHDRGHEIASHTCSHALLDQLSPADLARELQDSKARLEHWIGAEVPGFCYPNGNHNGAVRQAVLDAGYRWACTTKSGRFELGGDPFLIPRLDIAPGRVLNDQGQHDAARFRAELCRFHEHLQRTRR